MCVAAHGKVIKAHKGKTLVNLNGNNIEVNTELVENVEVGDYLLIYRGCAIEKINKIDSKKYGDTLKLVCNIGDENVFK